jgi:uncharacterized membrane protein YbaN (DUF454 family)
LNPHASSRLRIIHSSVGRLRVHLPDANGAIDHQIRTLSGVTSATTNSWSRNILILFDPRQTTEQTLLRALEAPAAEVKSMQPPAPAPRVVPATVEPPPTEQPAEIDEIEPVGYVTGLRRRLYRFFGWAALGMAVVGAITPGIPTVPFVLLGSYFFIRSSPQTHAWMLRSRWFGPILHNWEKRRGVSRTVKWAALGLIGVGVVVTLLAGLPTVVVASILAIEFIGIVIVLRLPVVDFPLGLTPQAIACRPLGAGL